MHAMILACVFAVSAVNPSGTTRTVRLTTKQVKAYEHLKAMNLVDDEQSYTEFDRGYLIATCAKVFQANPDLAFIQGGAK